MSEQQKKQPYNRPVTDEAILKVTKEIVVKFIELGRLSPSTVHESIRDIHATIRETVKGSMDTETKDQE